MLSLDLIAMSKYMIPAALVVVVIIYLFIRKFVLSYRDLRNSVRVHNNAAKLRQTEHAAKAPPVIVRRTDLYDQLSPEQKNIHKQAEDLAAQKNFRDAARLFESINFQRKAIDLLEFNGLIEEAAEILLRMKVPYRAAIIYERNNQFIKAAECFTLDNKHDNAGRCYDRAAAADFHLYQKAGECYLAAGMIDACLDAFGKILNTPEILRICLGSGKVEFLAGYMADPYNAKQVLEQMTPEQIEQFVGALGLRPCWVQSMSVWVLYHHELRFFHSLLQKLVANQDLSVLFWSHLSAAYCNHLMEGLSRQPYAFSRETYEYHGAILVAMKRAQMGDFFQRCAALPPAQQG